jgi:hypothetical protein
LGLLVLALMAVVLGMLWWQQHAQRAQVRYSADSLLALGNGFLQRLQGLLLQSLQSGPDAAVRICADTAQRFTEAYARQYGIELRRAALRWRNPRNRADSLEAYWIERFQQWKQEGRTLDTVVVLRYDGYVHVLKPIVLGNPICLMCHGTAEEIPPAVAQLLQERYPEDRARNFRLGDVRGALSVRARADE